MTESVLFTEKDDRRDAGSRGRDKKWDTYVWWRGQGTLLSRCVDWVHKGEEASAVFIGFYVLR